MSIITCTAKTRNDLTVARIVIEVLAQSLNYRLSVTYNDGKSFDVMVPDGQEDNAIAKFKRQAPDLDIYKSSKSTMAKSQKESRKLEYTVDDEDAYDSGYDAGKDDKKDDDVETKDHLKASGKSDEYIAGYMDAVKEFKLKSKGAKKESDYDDQLEYEQGYEDATNDIEDGKTKSDEELKDEDPWYVRGYKDRMEEDL